MSGLSYPRCSLCGVEKVDQNSVAVCMYCDFLNCVHCGEPAPSNYVDTRGEGKTACPACGKRHPGVESKS